MPGYELSRTLLKELPEKEKFHSCTKKESTFSFLSCGIQSYLEEISNSILDWNLLIMLRTSYTSKEYTSITNSEVKRY